MEYEGGLYLNPAYPAVRSLIARGAGEIAAGYAVDGRPLRRLLLPLPGPRLGQRPPTAPTPSRRRSPCPFSSGGRPM